MQIWARLTSGKITALEGVKIGPRREDNSFKIEGPNGEIYYAYWMSSHPPEKSWLATATAGLGSLVMRAASSIKSLFV